MHPNLVLRKQYLAGLARVGLILAMFIGLAGLLPVPAQAQTTVRYAAPGGQTSGSCDSWANACELRYALSSATSGQEIWVKAGVYKPLTGNYWWRNSFELKSGVAVYGGFAGGEFERSQRNWTTNVTILSGDYDNDDINTDGNFIAETTADIVGENFFRVVTGATDAILDGVTITAAMAPSSYPYGGGMYNYQSHPTLANVVFSGNRNDLRGGGMYNDFYSAPTLTNVIFSGNSADESGGALYNDRSQARLTNVIFRNNSSRFGGGLYDQASSSILTNVTFSGNSARDDGGGMYARGDTPALTNVIFGGNTAGRNGGGLYNYSSNLTLTNVSFSGNQAISGGGIYNHNSNPTLTNSIIWNNRDSSGTGTAAASINNFESTPTIRYSDVQGCNPGGAWVSGCGANGGNNLADADPLFVTPVDPDTAPTTAGNLRLQAGSPAINAGNNAAVPAGVTTDLDGKARIQGGVVDLGVYEYPPCTSLTSGDWSTAGTWDCGRVPNVNELVVIAGGHTVTLSGDVSFNGILTLNGNLNTGAHVFTLGSAATLSGSGEIIGTARRANPTTGAPLFFNNAATTFNFATAPTQMDVTLTKSAHPNASGADREMLPRHYTLTPTGSANATVCLGYQESELGAVAESSLRLCRWDGSAWNCQPRSASSSTAANSICADNVSQFSDWTIGLFTVLYAVPGGQTSGECREWATACELRYALSTAVSGQEIWTKAGVYKPTGSTTEHSATFQFQPGVAVYGGFAGTETQRSQRNWATNITILSGDIDGNDTNSDGNFIAETAADIQGANSYTVVKGANGATLDGVTVTAGQNTLGNGGGMVNTNSSPTLTNVTFSGNSASSDGSGNRYGGGMYNNTSSPTLTNVTFTGNRVSNADRGYGGGMYNDTYSHATLTDVTFSGNSASGGDSAGGGLYNNLSNPTLTRVTFRQNSAGGGGGGMLNEYSSPTLTHVTLSGNSAIVGGGMSNYGGSPVLVNVVFSGNSATSGISGGGGLFNNTSSPILTNVTFSGNSAPNGSGGGIYNTNTSDPRLRNVIIWNNQASSGAGTRSASIFKDINSTPNVGYSLVQGCNPGDSWQSECGTNGYDNLSDADPLFVTPVDPTAAPTTAGDLRLQAGSPAIDKGRNNADLDGSGPGTATISDVPTDLAGSPRIQGRTVELGAYESTPSCTSLSSSDWSTAGTWSCGRVPGATDQVIIAGGHAVTLSGAVTHGGPLTLNGNLDTGAHVLTLGAAAALSGSGEIVGTVRRTGPATGSALPFNNAATRFNFAAAPTQMDVKLTKSAHPNANANGGGSQMLARYYTLTPTGSVNAAVCLGYQDGELGAVAESSLRLCRWDGSAWNCPSRSASSSTTANSVCADNVTQFSDWTIGATGPTAVSLAAFTGNSPATTAGPLLAWLAVLLAGGFALYRRTVLTR